MADADTTTITATIASFLERVDKVAEFDPSTPLYADGLGLDSLETAELSALLEDEFGSDPFNSAAEMPETVGDVLAFYDSSEADPSPATA